MRSASASQIDEVPVDAATVTPGLAGHREVEDKYDVDADAELPALQRVAGVARVDPPVRGLLEASYFDTHDLALNAAHITLRRRTGGADAGWHLKLPDDGARHEVRLPLGPASTSVPRSLRSILLAVLRGRPLVPVVALRTDRTVHALRDAAGILLAEVADDRVEAETFVAPDTPEWARWREWEVELVEADETLLAAVGTAFRVVGARPSPWSSKLARALRTDGTGGGRSVPALRPDSAASELGQAYLTQEYERLLACDPLVRCEVPDAIHRMRVTTRRLRAVLAAFRPILQQDVTEPVRDELAWLCSALGEARDAEVMVARVSEMLAAETGGPGTGEVPTRITRDLTQDYDAAYRRARRELESDRYLLLLDRLKAVTDDPPWTAAARKPVRSVLRRRLRHEWRRLEEAVVSVDRAEDPVALDRAFHAARRAAKRVRYTAEPLAIVYGRKATRLVDAATRIQTILGDHQDSVVTRATLDRLRERAAAEGEEISTFDALNAINLRVAAGTADEFEAAWRAVSKKKLRRWLR